jgi:hypothetical protein
MGREIESRQGICSFQQTGKIETFFQFHEMWQISDKQKSMLRDDWTILRSSLESVGVVTFLNLFETHPETLRPFIQVEDSLPAALHYINFFNGNKWSY